MAQYGALELLLASWPDEDDLVAELWVGDAELAKVVRRDDRLVITFYSATSDREIPLADLREALGAMEERLGPPPIRPG